MKRKFIFLSTLILLSLLVAGGTMAWFTDKKSTEIRLIVKYTSEVSDIPQVADDSEESAVKADSLGESAVKADDPEEPSMKADGLEGKGLKAKALEEPIVKVGVLEPGENKITGVEADQTYKKDISVINLGSEDAYIRVRIIPQWDNPSLPVSNVVLDLADNPGWVNRADKDGYYYYKSPLGADETTTRLVISIKFEELGSEYAGETLTLKVAAEGIQGIDETWDKVWGLN